MAVQYRVSGDVPVTAAIAPAQHNWSPLYRGLELEEAKRQAKLKAEAEAQAAKATQAADEAKYNPGGILDVDYNDVVHNKGLEVLDYSAKSYASGRTGSGEHNYNINRLRQEAELYKGKSNAAIAEYTKAYQNIDQLPSYVNKNLLNTKVYDVSHPKGKNGKVDINAIDPKAIAEVPANYYGAINTADMYNEKVKGLGEKIQRGEVQFPVGDPNDPNAIMNVMKSDMYKAKFFKPVADKYGKITYVPGVTDQAAQFMLESDPEIMGEAKNQLQQYIQAETAQRAKEGDKRDLREIYNDVERGIDANKFLIDHVKVNLERLNAPTHETKRETTIQARPGGDKDKDKVKLGDPVESNININLGEAKGGYVSKAWVPSEQTISSKGEGKVQPLSVNAEDFINIDKNERERPVGTQSLHPRAFVTLPVQKIDGQEQIYVNSKDKVLANKNVFYKKYVDGQIEYDYTDDTGRVHHKKKSVLIDAEKVANELVERGIKMEDYIPKQDDPYGVK